MQFSINCILSFFVTCSYSFCMLMLYLRPGYDPPPQHGGLLFPRSYTFLLSYYELSSSLCHWPLSLTVRGVLSKNIPEFITIYAMSSIWLHTRTQSSVVRCLQTILATSVNWTTHNFPFFRYIKCNTRIICLSFVVSSQHVWWFLVYTLDREAILHGEQYI